MTIEDRIVELVRSTVEQNFDRLLCALEQSNSLNEKRNPGKLLYTEPEAATMLGVSALTLKKWRQDGLIRAHTQVKPILYEWADIEAISEWLGTRESGGAR